jgi:hypothetical protein
MSELILVIASLIPIIATFLSFAISKLKVLVQSFKTTEISCIPKAFYNLGFALLAVSSLFFLFHKQVTLVYFFHRLAESKSGL